MNRTEAVQILRDAVERSTREKVKTPEVRAALMAARPHMERWPLDWFWDCADSENDIGRSQNTRPAFRGILRQLGLPDE